MVLKSSRAGAMIVCLLLVIGAIGTGMGQPEDYFETASAGTQSDAPRSNALEERDRVSFEGDHWIAWRVSLPEDEEVEYRFEGERQDSLIAVFGDWVMHVDPLRSSIAFVASTSQRERQVQHVQAIHEEAVVVSHKTDGTQDGSWGGFGWTKAYQDLELYIVLVAASDGHLQEGEFSISATANVTVQEPTMGPAFFATETDFTGGVNVVIDDWVMGHHVQSKIIKDAAIPMTVENRLFGLFKGDVDDGTLQMGYNHPFGSQACPADSWSPYTCFLSGEPSGDYRFRIDENIDPLPPEPVHSALHGPPEEDRLHMVWLLAADVKLE